MLITVLVLILDYFQEKHLTYVSKNPKHPILDRNEFPWKKGLCQFLNIPVIYHFELSK